MMNDKQTTKNTPAGQPRRIVTSANSPALARKIKQASAYYLKVNDKLYKELANK